MTDHELRKKSRAGLLEILLEQSREIERLRAEIDDLNEQLDDKYLVLRNSGSIAEASLRLNKVFEAAQNAADQYVSSIRHYYSA